jgi:hypothetical protein
MLLGDWKLMAGILIELEAVIGSLNTILNLRQLQYLAT